MRFHPPLLVTLLALCAQFAFAVDCDDLSFGVRYEKEHKAELAAAQEIAGAARALTARLPREILESDGAIFTGDTATYLKAPKLPLDYSLPAALSLDGPLGHAGMFGRYGVIGRGNDPFKPAFWVRHVTQAFLATMPLGNYTQWMQRHFGEVSPFGPTMIESVFASPYIPAWVKQHFFGPWGPLKQHLDNFAAIGGGARFLNVEELGSSGVMVEQGTLKRAEIFKAPGSAIGDGRAYKDSVANLYTPEAALALSDATRKNYVETKAGADRPITSIRVEGQDVELGRFDYLDTSFAVPWAKVGEGQRFVLFLKSNPHKRELVHINVTPLAAGEINNLGIRVSIKTKSGEWKAREQAQSRYINFVSVYCDPHAVVRVEVFPLEKHGAKEFTLLSSSSYPYDLVNLERGDFVWPEAVE